MNQFMIAAIKEAARGVRLRHGGPFGAVIVKNNKIISTSHNLVIKNNDPTAHAEINAIRKACKVLNAYHLTDCILYTTCEPCPMCYSAILWAHIKHIYYGCTRFDAETIGFDDKFIYDIIKEENKSNKIFFEQIGREECLKVFRKWKENNNLIY